MCWLVITIISVASCVRLPSTGNWPGMPDAPLKVMESYQVEVARLCLDLKNESNVESKAAVMFVLGELRAAEAAPILADLISFEVPAATSSVSRDPQRPWGPLPSLEALTKIGIAAVPVLVEHIARVDDIRETQLLLRCLHGIMHQSLGESTTRDDGKALSILILERALAREGDVASAGRLRRAIEAMSSKRGDSGSGK